MKRKSVFLIGFLSAAITFGTLMATVGPRHFSKFRHHACERSEYNDAAGHSLRKAPAVETQLPRQ